MNAALRKFIPRAPRYVLRPQDRNVMRFSLEDTVGPAGVEETLLLNLSESGAAFVTSKALRIEVGERIKVEVPVPSGEQIAWWAKVVRVEEYVPRGWFSRGDAFSDSGRVIVALKFEDLPQGHSKSLRKGIEQSFLKAARDQRHRTYMYYKVLLLQHLPKAILVIALTLLAFAVLYWLQLPDEHYDSKRGAPWGERIKF
jgi:hypothetical protein